MRRAIPSVRRTRVLAAFLAGSWLLSATTVALANGVTGGWHRIDLPGVTGPSRLEGVASQGDGFVAVGTDDGLVGPAVWRSDVGASWDKVSFAAFGLVSVGLWAYFRFRRTSAGIAVP
jgi:hypothetical protein